MKKTSIIISLIIVTLLIGASLILSKNSNEVKGDTDNTYVNMEDGKQVIKVIANNRGYFPRSIEAKANIETILRVESQNSYGCERAFKIPSLNITEILPSEGITEFPLGKPKDGSSLFGSCSMGMYTFRINFK